MKPRISVLVPTYNYARYLPEAIRSILSQRFTDFELLILDNASTDGTAEAVAPFLSDPRVVYRVNATNVGMVPNWNLAMQAARGTYLKFLLSDDLFQSDDALARYAAVLDDDPSIALVASARHVVDDRSLRTDTWSGYPDGFRADGAQVIRELLETNVNLIGEPTCVMFRREHAARGFDPRYRQLVDLEMWFHLLEQGGFAYLAEPLVAFRRHAAQATVSNTQGFAHVADAVHLIDDYAARYRGYGPLQRHFRIYNEWYRLWRSARRGECDPRLARERIAAEYGLPRFLLEIAPYKLYRKVVGF